MQKEYYQQGDVLLKQTVKPSGKLISIESGIVAAGEATGHHHRITNGDVFKDDADNIFVKACEYAKISHEEHKEIMLEPAWYGIEIVKEYDHFAEEARAVVD